MPRVGGMPVPPAGRGRLRVSRLTPNAVPSGPRRSSGSPRWRSAIHSPPLPSGFTMSSISPARRSMPQNEYGRRSSGSQPTPGRTCTNCPACACAAISGERTARSIPRSPIRVLATTRPSSSITGPSLADGTGAPKRPRSYDLRDAMSVGHGFERQHEGRGPARRRSCHGSLNRVRCVAVVVVALLVVVVLAIFAGSSVVERGLDPDADAVESAFENDVGQVEVLLQRLSAGIQLE